MHSCCEPEEAHCVFFTMGFFAFKKSCVLEQACFLLCDTYPCVRRPAFMFQYFINLPIRSKLLLPTIIMVLGFLIAGASYWQNVQGIVHSDQRQQSLDRLVNEMLQMQLDISQTLQYEQKFLWQKHAEYLNLHQQSLQKVFIDIHSIQKASDALHLSLNTQPLNDLSLAYQGKFNHLRDEILRIGLDEKSGLKAQLKDARQQLQVDSSQPVEMPKSLLNMFLFEKDFMMHAKQQYIDGMLVQKKHFDRMLEQSNNTAAYKKDMHAKVNAYTASFTALAQAVLDSQKVEKALGAEITQVQPLLAKFNAQLNASLHEERSGLLLLIVQQKQQFFMVLLLLALVMGVLLWLISRSITRPLDQLLNLVHGLAQNGNLHQRLTVTGKHELAKMALYINQLMEHLSKMLSQVQQSGQKIITSSQQLSASSRDQEATVTEQAVTTQQMAASSREIANTANTLQENMENVATLARSTSQSAEEGQGNLQTLEHALSGRSNQLIITQRCH